MVVLHRSMALSQFPPERSAARALGSKTLAPSITFTIRA